MTNTEMPGAHQWANPGAGEFANPASAAPAPAATYRPAVAQQAPTLTFRSWQPGIVALRPLSFGDFLVVPFRAMKFNRAVVVGAPVLLATASALLTVLALWVAVLDPKLDFGSSEGGWRGVTAPTVILAIVALLAWVATDLFASALLVPAVARAFLGERITLKQAFATLRPRIGALVVLDLIVFGIVVLYSAVIGLGIAALATADSSGGVAAMGLTFGQYLLYPLALVLGVYVPAVRGAMVLEGAGPIRSIKRAIKLIPGRFWWTILILFVVRLAVGFAEQFSMGVGFVAALFVVFTPDSNAILLVVLALFVALGLIATCILEYSLAGTVNVLIYLDLRMRKEGLAFDMARAAEARNQVQQRVIG